MFDIYHIYGVWVNPNVIVFDKPRHLTDQNHSNYLPWIHTTVAQIILRIIYLMYIATIQHLHYRGQESETHSLCFIFLTHLSPWNKVKVIKPTRYVGPSEGYEHANFKRFCFNDVWGKVLFFPTRKYVNFLPYTCTKIKSRGIFMICLM